MKTLTNARKTQLICHGALHGIICNTQNVNPVHFTNNTMYIVHLYLLHNEYHHVYCIQWRSKGGQSAPGGKIEVILKNLVREKYFEGGEILGRGYKRAVNGRKIERLQKKSSKKFWDMRLKSRRAANLRSAPGGRHPSYATDCIMYITSCIKM